MSVAWSSSSSSSSSSSRCPPRPPTQLRLAIHSVLCRTSTTTIHAQCSLPDLNHDHPRPVFPAGPQPRPSTPSVPCRTSTTTIHAQCSLPDLNQKICQIECQIDMPDRMPEDLPDRMPEDMPDRMPNRMSEDMSDRMPEDVPVRTCINVMVGITRSKVFFLFFLVFPWFFCNLAKTSRKPKKKKNKKFRPMGKVWGEAWLGTWV